MSRIRLLTSAVIGAGVAMASLSAPLGSIKAYAESKTVRQEVGKPIQEAQRLQKEHKYAEALAALRKVDGVANKTPLENYDVELTRASIANQAGDRATAYRAFQAVLDSGMATPAQQLQIPEAISGSYYNEKNYTEAINWANRYFKAGGTDASMRTLLLQSYYLGGNYPETEKMAGQQIAASERAGQKPNETIIEMWANAAVKSQDKAEYFTALTKLITYYPEPKYWVDVIHRVASAPGFADRLQLDAERLEFRVGALTETNDVMDMIQTDLQEGLPGEAQSVTNWGYKKGLLGTGADAARQARLRAQVDKSVAQDQKDLARGATEAARAPTGDGLVNIGFSYVMYGQSSQGIPLMEQGIAKGSLKHPGQSRLHMGIAYLMGGQKAKAVQTFNSISDADGSGDLARLWKIAANQAPAS